MKEVEAVAQSGGYRSNRVDWTEHITTRTKGQRRHLLRILYHPPSAGRVFRSYVLLLLPPLLLLPRRTHSYHCLPLLTPLQRSLRSRGRVWHCRGSRLRGWAAGAKAGARAGTSRVSSIGMQTWTAATMSTASTGTAIRSRGSGATITLDLSTGMLPTLDPSIGLINYLLNARPAGSRCSSSSSSSSSRR